MTRRILLLALFLVTACGAPGSRAVTVYGGQYANAELFTKILLLKPLDRQDSYLTAVALSREIGRWPEPIRWEVEGQVVKHWKAQDHWELNALVIARWTAFPWNEHVPTSLALGEGVSWATETPKLEDEILGPEGGTSDVLNYLLLELTLGVLPWKGWSIVSRLHHRSGIFGLIHGVEEGSNFVTFGLRYEF